MKEFDEQAAIDYIRQQLPSTSREEFDDDEILNVIDMIWEYYDENGFLDMDMDDDGPDELNVDELLDYCKKMVAKDSQSPLSVKDVESIVKAELEYEETLDED